MTRSWQFFVDPEHIIEQIKIAGGIDNYIKTFHSVYGEEPIDITWAELVKIDPTVLMKHGDKFKDRTWDYLNYNIDPELFTEEVCAKYKFEREK